MCERERERERELWLGSHLLSSQLLGKSDSDPIAGGFEQLHPLWRDSQLLRLVALGGRALVHQLHLVCRGREGYRRERERRESFNS